MFSTKTPNNVLFCILEADTILIYKITLTGYSQVSKVQQNEPQGNNKKHYE